MTRQRELVLYLDGVDWQHELGEAADGTMVYPSLACIKKYNPCSDSCGVVQVRVKFSQAKWVHRQDFWRERAQPDEQVRAETIAAYRAKIEALDARRAVLVKRVADLESGASGDD